MKDRVVYNSRIYVRDPDSKIRSRQIYFSRKDCHGKKHYLHRVIYEDRYGKIPKDCVIRHKDNDHSNNSLDNLEAILRQEHHKNMHKISKRSPNKIKNCLNCHGEFLAQTNRSRFCSICKESSNVFKIHPVKKN